MITCMHKHYTVEEWKAWADAHPDALQYVAVSSGTSNDDFIKTNAILEAANVPFICLDVANGYSEHVRLHNSIYINFHTYQYFYIIVH